MPPLDLEIPKGQRKKYKTKTQEEFTAELKEPKPTDLRKNHREYPEED